MKRLSLILLLMTSIAAYAQQPGSDRDIHGCIPSAGYTWSKARKDCIRLFETGIRVESTDSTRRQAFIVFSPDSAVAEVFLPDSKEGELLYRRNLPNGEYAWNIEDDDTKNVRRIKGRWTIGQRGQIIYQQKQTSCGPSKCGKAHSCKKSCCHH